MKSYYLRSGVPAAVLSMLALAPAQAQRQITPEQRVERLERQVRQLQGRVFPGGQPAITAGTADEPAATASSVRILDQRLSTLEQQLTEILRLAEENGHRMRTLEASLSSLRAEQENRLQKLETAGAAAPAVAAANAAPVQPASAKSQETSSAKPKAEVTKAVAKAPSEPASAAEDPAELAYDEGYQLWKAGKYDQAVASLRAMASSFPNHRRVSWANNLVGRSLLDKGQARPAAEALLANYRSNPKGERAADSLYYLGQALMKLGQPSQACKAYAELEDVYGASIRAELKKLLPAAKSEAKCG